MISDDRETYREFVVGHVPYRLSIRSSNDFRALNDGAGMPGRVELERISRLYPDTKFRAYRSNDLT